MKKRPLSPHIQIYRWQWTMLGSILHRVSGIALSGALLLASVTLWAAVFEPSLFLVITSTAHSIVGRIILAIIMLVFSYHFSNGIRHLLWDIGLNFDLDKARHGAYIVWVSTAILTVIFLMISYGVL